LKIGNIRQLVTPDNYIGWKDIEYKVHETISSQVVKDIIKFEVNKLKELGENGQILMCINSFKNGHREYLDSYKNVKDCLVHTYNGDGVTTMVPSELFKNNLIEFAEKNDITWESDGEYITLKIDIPDFYQICDNSGHGIKLSIGKYMMARCITYTSKDRVAKASIAVAMIYKASSSISCTGMCQNIGRLFGTARPDMSRRLYCTPEVERNFKGYMHAQEEYFSQISRLRLDGSNENLLAKDVIKNTKYFNKVTRNIERPAFKQINSEMKQLLKGEVVHDENKIKEIVDRWWTSNTIIGKILRYIYSKGIKGVSEADLKSHIKDSGSINVEQMVYHLTTNGKENVLIFEKRNNMFCITQSARNYISKK
jgi:hypothetical protein